MAVSYWGTSGKMVASIQEKLRERGYYRNEIDGIFGAYTYYALIRFQRDNGLEANGIAENSVLNMLGIKTITPYDNELYKLAAFIESRGAGEPYTGQVAIGAVIINRVGDKRFPDSIKEVINNFDEGKKQITDDYSILDRVYIRASKDAFNGWDPSGGALWFRRKSEGDFLGTPVKKKIGGLVFG